MTIRSGILAIWPGVSWATLTVAPAGEGGTSASSYEENDLNSFAVAAVNVHRITAVYNRKMGEAKSDSERKQLQEKAGNEVVKAVKNVGLTLDAYQDIALRLESDGDLAERVKQKIKKVA